MMKAGMGHSVLKVVILQYGLSVIFFSFNLALCVKQKPNMLKNSMVRIQLGTGM